MKFLSRSLCGCLLFLAFLAPGARAQVGDLIQKIEVRHVGPPAASDELIRANIRVKEGDTYTKTSVDDDVRSLYSTGYFYNIKVALEPAEKGIRLVYFVQGKPVLSEVKFEGNKKYSRNKLLKKVTSKTGEPLDERKLFNDAQEIKKMYQKSGYQKTEVKYHPTIDEQAGRGTVTFDITESPKVKIDRVEFVGAEKFTQRKLRRTIKTRRHWMFSWITGSGVVKDEQFDEDKEKLIEFYQNAGYIDFEIKDVQFDYLNARHMILRIFVNEGRQYRVGSVEFKGNSIFNTNDIVQGIVSEGKRVRPKMLPGQIFTPKGLTADVDAIRDFYGSKGYIDTYVHPIKTPNTDRGTMDLVYQIEDEEKGKSYIEKIEIKGNIKTKDKVIRRELAVSPGETFDMVRVKISKSRLEQMGYFEQGKVETEVEPTDVPNRKNLVIDLEETSTGHVELGAGFSSIDSLFGFVGYREGNFDLFHPPYFRGGGQKLNIGVTIGLQRKDYQLSFTEPWFMNKRLAFTVNLYRSELFYLSQLYNLTQTGGKLSLTKAFPYNFVGSASYTLENIGIFNVAPTAPKTIQEEPRSRLISKIGGTLAYDTRNSVLLPNRGTRTELITELAGGPLAGEADFYKVEVRSHWFFPGFFQGHVLELEGRSGIVNNYGRSDSVPLFDRYFLGGVSNLRGYRYREVGPHEDGEPIGGRTFYLGSLEYSIPIIERLRFALFYDIGNVFENAYSFKTLPDQTLFNDNYGFGIRLNIPRLGPLRLDYGIPITHDPGLSGGGRFQFSVGFTRDY